MFKTKRNYPFDDFASIPPSREYKIGKNDVLEIRIVPNKGANIIENEENINSNSRGVNSVVEFDGTVKVPVLGRIPIENLSVREAELLLEERLKTFYVDPYVNIKVLNKRVILFNGEAGSARVIQLSNQNTNLLEVLAAAGGVSGNGKANRIKLIRGDLKNPKVYLIDLTTIDGMKKADLNIEGNDIIYVEPRNDYAANFLNRTGSFLALFNLAFAYFVLFN